MAGGVREGERLAGSEALSRGVALMDRVPGPCEGAFSGLWCAWASCSGPKRDSLGFLGHRDEGDQVLLTCGGTGRLAHASETRSRTRCCWSDSLLLCSHWWICAAGREGRPRMPAQAQGPHVPEGGRTTLYDLEAVSDCNITERPAVPGALCFARMPTPTSAGLLIICR